MRPIDCLPADCPSSTTTESGDALPVKSGIDIFSQSLHSLGRHSVRPIDGVLMYISNRREHRSCSLQSNSPSRSTFWITRGTVDPPDKIWLFLIFLIKRLSHCYRSRWTKPLLLPWTCKMNRSRRESQPHRYKVCGGVRKCSNLQEVVLESYVPGRFPDFPQGKMSSI